MLYALNGSALNGWATLFAGGASALQLVGAGTAGLANKAGTGVAALVLSATGVPLLAKIAPPGSALLDIEARHGLPNPMPIPAGFMGAHKRAVLLVPPQARDLRVPAEPIERVPARQRVARVPRERTI